ncbi:MAG: hypothetical protein NTW21_27950 [Verrucomicrobia bacterium]|nr:hypothetical protein [Verrucomicrobiota bacterium]
MKRTLIILTFALYCTASGVARAADNDNTRTFTADKRYLLFPCARGFGGQDKVFIHVDGKPYMSHYSLDRGLHQRRGLHHQGPQLP